MRRLPFLLFLAACAPGEGEVHVTAWGEDAGTRGIDAGAFEDGWSITFERLLLTVSEPLLRDQDSEEVLDRLDGDLIVDLASAPSPRQVGILHAPSGRHWFEFASAPPQPGAQAPGIDEADVQTMIAEGWSRWVQGTATRGEEQITFNWGFHDDIGYTLCEDGRDRLRGLAVPSDGMTSAQITVHLEHLFFDTLGTEEASLRFDPIAQADADGDGEVTAEELAAVDVIGVGYETAGLDLPDLWSFLSHSFAIAPHLNGGGLCTARSR